MNRLLLPVLGATLTLGATLALGACHQGRDTLQTGSVASGAPRYASLDATLDGTAAQPQRVATPVAVLPAWIGRPTRLREHDDADAFEQVVSLDLSPKSESRGNLVMLTLPRSRAAMDRLDGGGASVMGKPSEAGIRAELEAVFPGVPMQVVTRPASNEYGPYGLAIGRNAGGARCLYAWQWIETPPALDSGVAGPLSVRVRLCRSDITLEAMAASVNQLRLVPRFEGTPVTVASRPAEAAARPASERRHRSRHARAAQEPRRTLRREARQEPRQEPRQEARYEPRQEARYEPRMVSQPSVLTVAAPDTSGRRYLGAESGPAPSYRPASAPAGTMRGVFAGLGGPAPGQPSGSIAADLPPEAYRGPSSGQSR